MAVSPKTYALGYSALAGLVLLLTLILPADDPIAATISIANEEKRLESLLEVVNSMIALITTLNTAMLAGAAAVAVKGREWSRVWSPVDAAILILVFLSGAISYLGIYVAYVALLEMIESAGFSALAPRLQLGFALQFYGTLLGFLLLGLVFSRLMAGRRTTEPKKETKKAAKDED